MYAHWFRIIGNKRQIKTDKKEISRCILVGIQLSWTVPSPHWVTVGFPFLFRNRSTFNLSKWSKILFSYRSNALEISIRNWIVTYAAGIDSSKPTSFPRETDRRENLGSRLGRNSQKANRLRKRLWLTQDQAELSRRAWVLTVKKWYLNLFNTIMPKSRLITRVTLK